jgi:hypothetical protein
MSDGHQDIIVTNRGLLLEQLGINVVGYNPAVTKRNPLTRVASKVFLGHDGLLLSLNTLDGHDHHLRYLTTPLIQQNVAPAPITHLPYTAPDAHQPKATALVQRNRGGVLGKDAGL